MNRRVLNKLFYQYDPAGTFCVENEAFDEYVGYLDILEEVLEEESIDDEDDLLDLLETSIYVYFEVDAKITDKFFNEIKAALNENI